MVPPPKKGPPWDKEKQPPKEIVPPQQPHTIPPGPATPPKKDKGNDNNRNDKDHGHDNP